MLERVLTLLLSNYSLVMLLIAVGMAVGTTLLRPTTCLSSFGEQLFRWTSLLALGLAGIYTAMMHVLFPAQTAANIGWAPSTFQYEVGMADLTAGVLGILAFRASHGFRLATTIASVCWLWGDAVGHVWQMIVAQNFASGNAGSWLLVDLLVPLILILSLVAINYEKRTATSCTQQDAAPNM